MSWEDQPAGTWQLYVHVAPGSSQTEDLVVLPTYRACVEVARAIKRGRPELGQFSASYKRSDERWGAEVDGFVRPISLEPPEHDPSLEFTLSDGRTVWLEDVDGLLLWAIRNEESAAAAHDIGG